MLYVVVGLLSLINVYLIYRVSHLYALAEDWRKQAINLEREAASWNQHSGWTTYEVCTYTHDVANDQRSAGGVHIHQVRCVDGQWQHRICQANERAQAYSSVSIIDEADGLKYWEAAQQTPPVCQKTHE